MIGRFVRQLLGCGRRAKLAREAMEAHHTEAETAIKAAVAQQHQISAQATAVEQLVRALKKDMECSSSTH